MLRKDVVEAVGEGRFRIYAVKTIDEGIEILIVKEAGKNLSDGIYPDGSINYLVDKKLNDLAEGIKKFGDTGKKKRRMTTRSRKP